MIDRATPKAIMRRSIRRGGMLFELILSVGASVFASTLMLDQLANDATNRRLAAIAQQMQTIRNAAEMWMTANFSAINNALMANGCGTTCRADVPLHGFLLGNTGDGGTLTTPAGGANSINPSQAGSCTHTSPTSVCGLVSSGYLPNGWTNNAMSRSFVRVTLARHTDGRLEGYVSLQAFGRVTNAQAWQIAQAIGAPGGVLDPRMSTTVINGTRGGWTINTAAAPWNTNCVTAAGGRGCYVPANGEPAATFYYAGW